MKSVSFKMPDYLCEEITLLAQTAHRQEEEELALRLEDSLLAHPIMNIDIRELEKLKLLLLSDDFSKQQNLHVSANLHQRLESASHQAGQSMPLDLVCRIQQSVRERIAY